MFGLNCVISKRVSRNSIFAELDADKNMRIVEKCKIRGIPAYLFFKRGELVDMLVGTTQRGI